MKYSDDGPFVDPIVRCDGCHKLIFREKVQNLGLCEHCGHRRVRKVMHLREEEMQWAKDKKVDPEFLSLFEGVEA